MPGKRHGGHGHHKAYKGPWPEDHRSIPGRDAKTGSGEEKHHPEGGAHTTPVHKIPQQAPKPK